MVQSNFGPQKNRPSAPCRRKRFLCVVFICLPTHHTIPIEYVKSERNQLTLLGASR